MGLVPDGISILAILDTATMPTIIKSLDKQSVAK